MPATTGDFGVMPGHVPTVAQLRCASMQADAPCGRWCPSLPGQVARGQLQQLLAGCALACRAVMHNAFSQRHAHPCRRPGVVTVHKELDKSVEKYFVSGGFAFVHPDSTADICAVRGAAGRGTCFCRRVAATGKMRTAAAWAGARCDSSKMCARGKQSCELYLLTGLGNCSL